MKSLNDLLRNNPELAMQQMLTAYGGLVYSVVRSILPSFSAEEVEECVSDAFLYVFEHRQRLDFSKGSIKAYLCTTAKNRAFDRLRRHQKEQKFQGVLDKLYEPDASAEELVLLKADRDALVDAILALGDPDGKILIYRYYFNLKSAEIAQLVGLKPNTVDQRAGRALKKLSQILRKGEAYE